MDNGVYHKFVYSSHDAAVAPNEAKLEETKCGNLLQVKGDNRVDRQALADDGALSSKMKMSTRNNMKGD